jgi:hypothetical protein
MSNQWEEAAMEDAHSPEPQGDDDEEYQRFLRWRGDFPDYVRMVEAAARLDAARKVREWFLARFWPQRQITMVDRAPLWSWEMLQTTTLIRDTDDAALARIVGGEEEET